MIIAAIAIIALVAVCVVAGQGTLMPEQQENLLEFALVIVLVALLAVCVVGSLGEWLR